MHFSAFSNERFLPINDDANVLAFIQDSIILKPSDSFTPNADGINDNFEAAVSGIDSLTLRIYNRWGQKVADKTFSVGVKDHSLILWNGIDERGKPFQTGTYLYIIIAFDSKGNKTEKNGYVSLSQI